MKYKIFIRVSNEQFIDRLINEGQIYCSPLKKIREADEKDFRGDKDDALHFRQNNKRAELTLRGNKLISDNATLTMFYNGNIFCLYGVNENVFDNILNEKQKVNIHEHFIGMNDTALIIYNPLEFHKRLVAQLEFMKYKYEFKPVKYYEGEFPVNKKMSPFDKKEKFSFQNEVRLYIESNGDEEIEIFIGNISDIAFKCKSEKLKTLEVEFV